MCYLCFSLLFHDDEALARIAPQERHSAVLHDCTEAVARVDSAKPRLRRALAHEALQQFAQAADDFRAVLAFDPSAKVRKRRRSPELC